MNKTNQPAMPENEKERSGNTAEVAKKSAAAVAGVGAMAGMGGATAVLAKDLNGSQELVDDLASIVVDDIPAAMTDSATHEAAQQAQVKAEETVDVESSERVQGPARTAALHAQAVQGQHLADATEQLSIIDNDTILAQVDMPDEPLDPIEPIEPAPDEPLWAFSEGTRHARSGADVNLGDFGDGPTTQPIVMVDSEELIDPDDINSIDWLTNNEMQPVNVGHNDKGQATALLKLVDDDGYETNFTMVDTNGDGVFDVLEDAFGYQYTEYAGKLDLNVSDVQARLDSNLSVPLSPYMAFGQVEVSPDDLLTIQGNADSEDIVYLDVNDLIDIEQQDEPIVLANDFDEHLAYVVGARDQDVIEEPAAEQESASGNDDYIIVEMDDDPLLASSNDNEESEFV